MLVVDPPRLTKPSACELEAAASVRNSVRERNLTFRPWSELGISSSHHRFTPVRGAPQLIPLIQYEVLIVFPRTIVRKGFRTLSKRGSWSGIRPLEWFNTLFISRQRVLNTFRLQSSCQAEIWRSRVKNPIKLLLNTGLSPRSSQTIKSVSFF